MSANENSYDVTVVLECYHFWCYSLGAMVMDIKNYS